MRYLKTFESFRLVTQHHLSVIREFYEKGYNLGDYDVKQKIEDEVITYNKKFMKLSVDERSEKIGEYKDFINETILKNFKDYYKAYFNEEMNKIVCDSFLVQRTLDIYFTIGKWEGVYFWGTSGLKLDGLNYVINYIKDELDTLIEPKIKGEIKSNSYSLSPEYTGKNIQDDLQKRIYDWEHTKTIIEKLLNKFLTSDKINDDLFNKLKEKNLIDEIINKMDKIMEENNYETFHSIKEINLKNDFHKFFESYIKYYSKHFNEEQLRSVTINLKKNLPLEILMSKLFNMIYKNL